MLDPIDAVVTWVDSSCPFWKEAREIYAKDQPDCFFTPPDHPDSEVDLCMSLILKNLPWLRHIWLVTMRPQIPKCMSRPEFQKVKVIHHDEFMSQEFLPTFDSRAIECNLWKISGLSENFIYFNDDVYVLKQMSKEAFFRLEKPIAWISKAVPKEWRHSASTYRKSWSTLANSFEGTRLLHHVPLSMTKTIMQHASLYFEEAWSQTCKSRTRTSHTIPAIGATINLAIKNKHVVVDKLPKILMKEAVVKPTTVPVLLNKNAYFLCVNRQPFNKTHVFCDKMRLCLL
jgi:hypothetical protein